MYLVVVTVIAGIDGTSADVMSRLNDDRGIVGHAVVCVGFHGF